MNISKKDVTHVAKLARLELNEKEIEKFTEKLTSVLTYVEKLKEVDTQSIEPTYHINSLVNILREDKVEKSLDRKKVLQNAPESENGYFKIPGMME